MKNNKSIVMVGVGGQGIILASDIVSSVIMRAGYDVKKSEVHGMSQRGGSVFSFIRYGEKVYSPVVSEGEADILIALELMETLRWINYANKNTVVVYNNEKIWPTDVLIGKRDYPENISDDIKRLAPRSYEIDGLSYIEKIGNKKYLNTVILGVISNHLEFDVNIWLETIKELVPARTIEDNIKAFNLGREIK